MKIGPEFYSTHDDSVDGAHDLQPESPTEGSTRQVLLRLDLGPTDFNLPRNLGPYSQEEARVFEQGGEPFYIETRESSGFHCMDDRVTRAGIQLPGGLLETMIASRMMDYDQPQDVKRQYKSLTDAFSSKAVIWTHGGCAAGAYKREALAALPESASEAMEFVYEICTYLGVPYRESGALECVYLAGERARNDELWNVSFETGSGIARKNPGVHHEEFDVGHKAAGLRIDLTPNMFNNEQFRKNNKVGGEEIGLLSVTLGAYKKWLLQQGYTEDKVAAEIIRAGLFTFGLIKIAAHHYTEAGIVVPYERGGPQLDTQYATLEEYTEEYDGL